MTDLEKRLLQTIQVAFPVTQQPFALLARQLGASETDVLTAISALKQAGVIRRLGALFDARRLGYVSTLAAAQVPQALLEPFVADVQALPDVSHCYGREHELNVWFTLTMPNWDQLERTLANLWEKHQIDTLYSLPARRLFKLHVHFPVDEVNEKPATPAAKPHAKKPPHVDLDQIKTVKLTAEQVALVRALQEDWPLVAQPFAAMAQQTGQDEQALLEQTKLWLTDGTIRRLGAMVRHHTLGYDANALLVFAVEPEAMEAAGRRLASYQQVSHCYERAPAPGWPYNLYAMLHARQRSEVLALVEQMRQLIEPEDAVVLWTTTEYKKVTVKYFQEPAT